jgi:hypothetical protein
MMRNAVHACLLLSTLLALCSGPAIAGTESGSTDSKIAIVNASFIAQSPEKENLNGEWVEVANQGSSARSLDNWTLEDSGNHTYTFGNFSLNAGASVKVHTGIGVDSTTDLYWGRSSPVWNNAGDVATLKDADGNVVAAYPEGSKGS